MELDEKNSNVNSISNLMANQLHEEVVILDVKFLKVVDNEVTNKQKWWSSGTKKFYVVSKTDFEVRLENSRQDILIYL